MHRRFAPVFTVVLVLALPALAQQNPSPMTDREYCEALITTYNRFLGQSSARSQYPDVSAGVAIADCQKGNTAAGIPVLEQKLRNAGFSTPGRETYPTRN